MRATICLLLLVCSIVLNVVAPAQGQAQEAIACEPITYAGVQVACLQQGIGSFSSVERARAIEARIQKLASDPLFDPSRLAEIEHEGASNIVVDDNLIASFRDGDLAEGIGVGRVVAAQNVVQKIRSAILADRSKRSPIALLWGAAYSVLATIGLIAVLMALRWVFPRLHAKIQSSDGTYIKTVRIQSFELLNSARIVMALTWLLSALRVALTLIALYIFIPLVLSFFPWTANWAPKLFGYILEPIFTISHVVIDYIPKFFFLVVISLVTRYLLKLVRFFFQEVELGHLRFEGFYKEWADPTYKLVRVLIIAFAFVMAFPYLPGSSSPAFQGVSVFLGILLSLGSSSAIANIVSGVVLTYMRPFRVGDRVKIADTVGDVTEKTLLVTRIRSIKNVDITIPNSMVLGSHIVNYSSSADVKGLILNTTVTIGYDVPWRQVHELLKQAASRTELIDQSKRIFVLQTALNDFYVSYELNAYTSSPNKMALIYSDLHQNIQDCFNEAGVEIMSPHYGSLRDGNETTIPANYRPQSYEAPRFRFDAAQTDAQTAAGGLEVVSRAEGANSGTTES